MRCSKSLAFRIVMIGDSSAGSWPFSSSSSCWLPSGSRVAARFFRRAAAFFENFPPLGCRIDFCLRVMTFGLPPGSSPDEETSTVELWTGVVGCLDCDALGLPFLFFFAWVSSACRDWDFLFFGPSFVSSIFAGAGIFFPRILAWMLSKSSYSTCEHVSPYRVR